MQKQKRKVKSKNLTIRGTKKIKISNWAKKKITGPEQERQEFNGSVTRLNEESYH